MQNLRVHDKNKNRLPLIRCDSINKKILREIDTLYLEKNTLFIREDLLKKREALAIFAQLIFYSKLYKANKNFLKKFAREFLNKGND